MEKKIKRNRASNTKNEIIALLANRKVALSHKDFQDYFENTVDRVTIYRALERLVEEGKLHKIANLDGGVQYALCKTCTSEDHKHEHVHFNCTTCKETTCLEEVEIKIKLPNSYKAEEQQIILYGICPKCSNQ